jgi:hypothetical protein
MDSAVIPRKFELDITKEECQFKVNVRDYSSNNNTVDRWMALNSISNCQSIYRDTDILVISYPKCGTT